MTELIRLSGMGLEGILVGLGLHQPALTAVFYELFTGICGLCAGWIFYGVSIQIQDKIPEKSKSGAEPVNGTSEVC